jgi:uncharacterized delta-60 repeat protein
VKKLYFFLFAMLNFQMNAQAVGDLDSTYGVNGFLVVNFGFANCNVSSQEMQQDGKLIVAGYARISPMDTANYYAFMIRFTVNGAVDADFGTNGVVLTDKVGYDYGDNFYDKAIVKIKSNGKIVIGGRGFLSQYNENGHIDVSFGNNGIVYPVFSAGGNVSINVKDIGFQADQSVIILGGCGSNPAYKTVFVYKYDTNGVHIPSFGDTLNHTGTPEYMIVQDDDSIVFTSTYAVSTSFGFYMRKLDATGVPTQLVQIESMRMNSLTKEQNGKFIVNYSDANYINSFTERFNPNLNLDTTFQNTSPSFFPQSKKISLVDDKLLFLKDDQFLVSFYRGNSVGTIDENFGELGVLSYIIPDNKQAIDFDIFEGNFYISGNTTSNINQKNIFIAKAFYQNPELGFEEITSDVKVRIYPNPAKDYIRFESLKLIGKIKIINLQGQIVKSKHILHEEILDVNDLPNGVYFIQFENLKSIKLIKK